MKSKLSLILVAAAALFVTGCAQTKSVSNYVHSLGGKKVVSEGAYKVGKPYRVGSVWYYPEENFRLLETGIASWYGPDFHGKNTANGERYDQNALTAAHRTLQMPSFVRVTNLENGRSVVVRINDRGPYLHGRVIDVSKRAAELLGFTQKGTARVRLEVLEKESRKVAAAARKGLNTSRMTLADAARLPDAPAAEPLSQPLSSMETMELAPVGSGTRLAAYDGSSLPESLQTPTITVEELSSPGQPAPAAAPVWTPTARPAVNRSAVRAPVRDGDVSDAVFTTETVRPTGLFVQAGSFTVKGNAEGLSRRLAKYARARIEPATVAGRPVYRVKLGPIATVAEADAILEKVIGSGQQGARVIRHN